MHVRQFSVVLKIIFLFFFKCFPINGENSTISSSTSSSSSSSPSSESAEKSASLPFSSKRIHGCPDLESFQWIDNFDSLSSGQLNRISCLCGPGHGGAGDAEVIEKEHKNEETASITCIYGSNLADLEHTLGLAKKANRTIERIVLTHMEMSGLDGKAFMQILMDADLSALRHLEVKKCRGQQALNMSALQDPQENGGGFDALESVDIEDCELLQIPTALLSRAPNVKSLSLANNKIHEIRSVALAAVKESLENLNLAGNLLAISAVEEGSLSQLKVLKNLEIGEHNFASETILREIGQLTNLESLDMSQMDGMERAEQFGAFQKMPKLKRLILTGCNLKALNGNGSSFSMFPALEWLDLRVNLIEKVESGCFVGLDNLRFVSLAGNFLKEMPEKLWEDLPQLEHLDLGWNDFRQLNNGSFSGINGSKLERLNLRNNEALREIQPGTFDGLTELRHLNLSTTMLGTVRSGIFKNLRKLKELDLSSANLSKIEPDAFEGIKASLEFLNLAANNLRQLDPNLLLGMDSLRLLDLSENPWLCDGQMQAISIWLDETYKRAAVEKREFELRHGLATICDRPYVRRGESIFDLIELGAGELAYDERMDTTTTTRAPMETTTNNGSDAEGFLNATIDWKAITLLVGSPGDEHLNFSALLEENARDDAKKPKYDIGEVKYGQKSVTKREANTWLSGVVVTLLVIVTAFCIIIVARRNKINSEDEIDEKKEEETMRRRVLEMESSSNNSREGNGNDNGECHANSAKVDERQQQQQQQQCPHQIPAAIVREETCPQQQQPPRMGVPKTDTDLEQNCATTTF